MLAKSEDELVRMQGTPRGLLGVGPCVPGGKTRFVEYFPQGMGHHKLEPQPSFEFLGTLLCSDPSAPQGIALV